MSLFLFQRSNAYAVPIGIVDSGVDFNHSELVSHTWKNPKEIDSNKIDDDKNGYIDDINGWNFAENNNQVIDLSYLGKFSPEIKKFFEVQLRMLNGTATDEDKAWIAEKKKDQKFIQELNTFGNFVHGTHVAGIASHESEHALIMAAKIIPTEVKAPIPSGFISMRTVLMPFVGIQPAGFFDDFIMNGALTLIAGQQTKLLSAVGQYLNSTAMQVANCSFGTSMEQAKKVVGLLGKTLLKRDLSEDETKKYAQSLMDIMIDKGSTFTKSSEQTLFVMAAGNDGTDNDQLPTFPANLKYDNTISVAATKGVEKLASFSNYGINKVEVAAPGVGIISTIPGEEKIALSGTSQAAPFVVKVAGMLMDANSNLTPSQVKQILMQTVDKKTFLKDKVTSGGIVNETRAVRAAVLSASYPLVESIRLANQEIPNLRSGTSKKRSTIYSLDGTPDFDGIALPLPSPLLNKQF
jgi:subtilisin family serine protease